MPIKITEEEWIPAQEKFESGEDFRSFTDARASRKRARHIEENGLEEEEARISRENQEQQQSRELITGADSKELSPEILAAREAAAAERQRAKDEAQAKIDAENREMRKRLAEAGGADSKGTAVGKGRAGWHKVGATVRFVQAASFPQQREETQPGDALAFYHFDGDGALDPLALHSGHVMPLMLTRIEACTAPFAVRVSLRLKYEVQTRQLDQRYW